MWKVSALAIVAVLVGSSGQAAAQTTPSATSRPLAEAASKSAIDRRVEVLKATLGLNPEQMKHWPAVEDAIRARLTERHARLAKVADRNTDGEIDPINVLRQRADGLAQRSAAMKRLADAWQPLYQTLDSNQKQRLQFVASYMFKEMRDAVANRRMQADDDDEDEL